MQVLSNAGVDVAQYARQTLSWRVPHCRRQALDDAGEGDRMVWESCTQRLQPPSIPSFPWEQGCETTSEARGRSKSWRTRTCRSSDQSLIDKVSGWNQSKGRKRGRTLQCHTLASPITASLPPCLIPLHPQNSLFISPGNSCPNVSLSGEKRQMPNIYSINRNIQTFSRQGRGPLFSICTSLNITGTSRHYCVEQQQ